jgi:hypothetical protein
MLTLKVNWGDNHEGFPMYSVYTAEKYLVDVLSVGSIRLLLDDGKHDISLGKGSKTYVMNDRGATVDTIIV